MKARQIIVATVFDKRGRVLATATNSYSKTHPKQKELAISVGLPEKEFLHAEVAATIKALKNGKPFKIKIERYLKDGSPGNACPCKICQSAIKMAGIKVVEYTI